MEAKSQQEQELYTELEEEVYHELEQFVADPAFCAALEKPFREGRTGFLSRWTSTRGRNEQDDKDMTASAASASTTATVQLPTANGVPCDASAAGRSGDTPHDNYVVVDKKDVVESMAYYIASCVADLPEAQTLTPSQLQNALVDALRVLKRSRFQRVCTWGRRMYRWGTYTYSAVQMYQNPWLMRALLAALWATSRISVRLLL